MKTLSQISHFSVSLPGGHPYLLKKALPKEWKISKKVLEKYLNLRKKSVGNHLFQILSGKNLTQEKAQTLIEQLSQHCFVKVLKAHQLDPTHPLEVNRYVKLHWLHEFSQALPDCDDEEEAFEFAQAVWRQILVWCLQGNYFFMKNDNGYIFEKENNFWWIKEQESH